jgi:TonB family protein
LFILVLSFFFLGSSLVLAKSSTEEEKPKLIKRVDPVYPEEARKAGLQGTVLLEATIDIHGKVENLKVVKGEHDILNQAALEAVKQWVYEPYLLDGIPAPQEFHVTIRFNLNGDKEKKEESSKIIPKRINKVDPVYPEEARKSGLSGIVMLDATIDIHGKVDKLKVVKGEHEILNKAAVEAVKQWVYEPVVIDGKPVPVKFTVTVKFALDSDKK